MTWIQNLEWFKTLEPNNKIQLIIAGILVLSAFFTFWAAWSARKSAKETRNTSLAQTLMQLMNDYSSFEMQESMVGLIDFKKYYDSLKDRDFVEEFVLRVKGNPLCDINKQRRNYSFWFHKIRQLLDNELVNKNFVKNLVTQEMVDPLLKIAEPMLKAVNPNYDNRTFNVFHNLYDELK